MAEPREELESPISPPGAVVLTGSLGAGHDAMASGCRSVLEQMGFEVTTVDAMALLGPRAGPVGEQVFRVLIRFSPVYDALHFSALRTGGSVASFIDHLATSRLVPKLRKVIETTEPVLVVSVFATGASAAAKAATRTRTHTRTVVLCTDVAVHRLWVADGTDLFAVTSEAAAASVRRFLPSARVAIVSPPLRPEFAVTPDQEEAREALGLGGEPVVLLTGGGWGIGSISKSAAMIVDSGRPVGVQVLAVAGRNPKLESRLRELAKSRDRLHAFGHTNRIATLMAAADLVVTPPGAMTCAEARHLGKELLLVDAMPGHGRDNLQHQLALGRAGICNDEPGSVTESVIALLRRIGDQQTPPDRQRRQSVIGPPLWEAQLREAFYAALG